MQMSDGDDFFLLSLVKDEENDYNDQLDGWTAYRIDGDVLTVEFERTSESKLTAKYRVERIPDDDTDEPTAARKLREAHECVDELREANASIGKWLLRIGLALDVPRVAINHKGAPEILDAANNMRNAWKSNLDRAESLKRCLDEIIDGYEIITGEDFSFDGPDPLDRLAAGVVAMMQVAKEER